MAAIRIHLLAASAVALVVLVDLATGQGPPVYTNYLHQKENFRTPPGPMQPMQPVGYVNRKDYDPSKIDKEYEKAIELGKVGDHHDRKKHEKEYEREYSDGGYEHGKDKKHNHKESESEAGMLSSLGNRVSGAWSSISPFGRKKRSTDDQNSGNLRTDTDAASSSSVAQQYPGASTPSGAATQSTGRSLDNYEYLQYKNQGYIYFKVPKHLVCGP